MEHDEGISHKRPLKRHTHAQFFQTTRYSYSTHEEAFQNWNDSMVDNSHSPFPILKSRPPHTPPVDITLKKRQEAVFNCATHLSSSLLECVLSMHDIHTHTPTDTHTDHSHSSEYLWPPLHHPPSTHRILTHKYTHYTHTHRQNTDTQKKAIILLVTTLDQREPSVVWASLPLPFVHLNNIILIHI